MNTMSRNRFLAGLTGLVAAGLAGKGVNAQHVGQAAGNDAQIVSTGNVHLGQNVAASQSVVVRDAYGNVVRGAGQTVYNDGQIVSTGDVWVEQNASASQDVEYGPNGGRCIVGMVFYSGGNLFYYDQDCTACPVVIECKKSCR